MQQRVCRYDQLLTEQIMKGACQREQRCDCRDQIYEYVGCFVQMAVKPIKIQRKRKRRCSGEGDKGNLQIIKIPRKNGILRETVKYLTCLPAQHHHGDKQISFGNRTFPIAPGICNQEKYQGNNQECEIYNCNRRIGHVVSPFSLSSPPRTHCSIPVATRSVP